MPDAEQLPHLMKLLEDTSPDVRQGLSKAFARFGPALGPALDHLSPPPGDVERHMIHALLSDSRRETLRKKWTSWFNDRDPYRRLESAFSLLSNFQSGVTRRHDVGVMLDALAAQYGGDFEEITVRNLAESLFKIRGLRGVAPAHYYHPSNSDLVAVMETRRGLPISLSVIYMLVGRRLGLTVRGCNFPGHFLCTVEENGEPFAVDCFGGGRFYTFSEMTELHKGKENELIDMLKREASPEEIMARVLRNLDVAYGKADQPENAQLVSDLFTRLASHKDRPDG
jgi:hypothetical protein